MVKEHMVYFVDMLGSGEGTGAQGKEGEKRRGDILEEIARSRFAREIRLATSSPQ